MVTCPYRHRTKWSVWLDGPGLTQLLEAWQEVGFLEVLFQFSFASLVQKKPMNLVRMFSGSC